MSKNRLPELCYSTLGMDGSLIVIKRDEEGYYPCTWSTNDREQNRKLADTMNEKLGVTKAQERAMSVGSMFGFNCAGADPKEYEYLDKVQGE